MTRGTAMDSADRDELIRLIVSVVLSCAPMLYMLNKTWCDHQVWRVRTIYGRKKRQEGEALRQVQNEISRMEHGEI